MIFSLCFAFIYKKFGSYTSTAAFILMSGALFVLYFFPHPTLLIVILTLMGGSYLTTITYSYQEASKIVPATCLSLAMGIIVGVQYISPFLATYITTGLMSLLNTDMLTPTLVFPAAWILLFAAFEYFSIKSYKKKLEQEARC